MDITECNFRGIRELAQEIYLEAYREHTMKKMKEAAKAFSEAFKDANTPRP